jgi:hypothetical protein
MKNKRLKMQFDERKRKLIISGTICSAKKRFFRVAMLQFKVLLVRTATAHGEYVHD